MITKIKKALLASICTILCIAEGVAQFPLYNTPAFPQSESVLWSHSYRDDYKTIGYPVEFLHTVAYDEEVVNPASTNVCTTDGRLYTIVNNTWNGFIISRFDREGLVTDKYFNIHTMQIDHAYSAWGLAATGDTLYIPAGQRLDSNDPKSSANQYNGTLSIIKLDPFTLDTLSIEPTWIQYLVNVGGQRGMTFDPMAGDFPYAEIVGQDTRTDTVIYTGTMDTLYKKVAINDTLAMTISNYIDSTRMCSPCDLSKSQIYFVDPCNDKRFVEAGADRYSIESGGNLSRFYWNINCDEAILHRVTYDSDGILIDQKEINLAPWLEDGGIPRQFYQVGDLYYGRTRTIYSSDSIKCGYMVFDQDLNVVVDKSDLMHNDNIISHMRMIPDSTGTVTIVAKLNLDEDLYVLRDDPWGELVEVDHLRNPDWTFAFIPNQIQRTPEGDLLLNFFGRVYENYNSFYYSYGGWYFTVLLDGGRLQTPVSTTMSSDTHPLRLYPNPTYDMVTLHNYQAGSTYHLLDLQGRHIKSGIVEPRISVQDVAPGIYTLLINDGYDTSAHRLMVQR